MSGYAEFGQSVYDLQVTARLAGEALASAGIAPAEVSCVVVKDHGRVVPEFAVSMGTPSIPVTIRAIHNVSVAFYREDRSEVLLRTATGWKLFELYPKRFEECRAEGGE